MVDLWKIKCTSHKDDSGNTMDGGNPIAYQKKIFINVQLTYYIHRVITKNDLCSKADFGFGTRVVSYLTWWEGGVGKVAEWVDQNLMFWHSTSFLFSSSWNLHTKLLSWSDLSFYFFLLNTNSNWVTFQFNSKWISPSSTNKRRSLCHLKRWWS